MQIDNTKRSTCASCPRKYQLRHIENLTSQFGSTALRFGGTWHGMMEGYYNSVKEHGWDSGNHFNAAIQLGQQTWQEYEDEEKEFYPDYRTMENCFESFVEYVSTFQSDKHIMEVIATERLYKIKMNLTDEDKRRYPYIADTEVYFTGKLDLEVSMSGQAWMVEHKTTGQSIQQQADRLKRSPQIIGYTWACKQVGSEVGGCLTNIHQISARRGKSGEYGKVTRNYLRQPNIFTDDDMRSWRDSFLYQCNIIAKCKADNHFPMILDSCYQFGQCGFVHLCEQNKPVNELIIAGYIKEEWDVLKTGTNLIEAEERQL